MGQQNRSPALLQPISKTAFHSLPSLVAVDPGLPPASDIPLAPAPSQCSAPCRQNSHVRCPSAQEATCLLPFQPAAGFLQPLLQTGQRHSSMDCGQYQQPPQVCPGYKGSEVDPVSQSCLGKIERRRSQMPQTHRPIRAGILVANCGVGSCRPQQ